MKQFGRRKSYTEIGIRRLPCFRCGAKASQQWQICADGNQYRPICKMCDIELNTLVLKFMGFKGIKSKIWKYKQVLEDSHNE